MSAVVADTHAAIWYIVEPNKLSRPALLALDNAANSGFPIHLPSISLVEICYLVEKRKLQPDVWDRVKQALEDPGAALTSVALDESIAVALKQVSRDDVPDRIIAATALHLQLPLVSRDRKIQASAIQTIW